MPAEVLTIATMDTKGDELAFVAQRLDSAGVKAITVDVGTQQPPTQSPVIPREIVAACHPRGVSYVLGQADRGQAVTAMGEALREFLLQKLARGEVQGVLGIGGSGGTALICHALRALPVGLPKVMVSTVASGNVAAYVDCSDLILMPSIVDVAGINAVSSRILSNAAHAIAGMVSNLVPALDLKPAIGMTMFGVTTTCVTAVRTALERDGLDCLVFHATGTGGRAMEQLVRSQLIRGVLDITTTEVADEVVGGVFPAGPHRFDAILAARVPYVMSLGALDMVNFGAMATVPEAFRNRRLHVHNPQVTLMRTTVDENRKCAQWIAAKLNRSVAPVTVLIPEKGVSALDAPGQAFHDPDADAALFDTLEQSVNQTPMRVIRRLPYHINDREFSDALVQAFRDQWSSIHAS